MKMDQCLLMYPFFGVIPDKKFVDYSQLLVGDPLATMESLFVCFWFIDPSLCISIIRLSLARVSYLNS